MLGPKNQERKCLSSVAVMVGPLRNNQLLSMQKCRSRSADHSVWQGIRWNLDLLVYISASNESFHVKRYLSLATSKGSTDDSKLLSLIYNRLPINRCQQYMKLRRSFKQPITSLIFISGCGVDNF